MYNKKSSIKLKGILADLKLYGVVLVVIALFVFFMGTVDTAQYSSEQRLATCDVVEDVSTIRIVGLIWVRYGSEYNIEDSDGKLLRIPMVCLDTGTRTLKVGSYVEVSRRRYYDKETGQEMYRQYKRPENEWYKNEY